jgi:hypothetical protein
MWEVAVILGILSISGILIYLSINLDQMHWPIKLFFLFTSFFSILIGSAVISHILDANNIISVFISQLITTVFWVFMVILILTLVYFMIKYLEMCLKFLKDSRK